MWSDACLSKGSHSANASYDGQSGESTILVHIQFLTKQRAYMYVDIVPSGPLQTGLNEPIKIGTPSDSRN